MEDVKTVYEINESNESPRFLTPKAFKIEYPVLYEAITEWDATFLNIASVKKGGAMVKSHPSGNIIEDEIETLEDVI